MPPPQSDRRPTTVSAGAGARRKAAVVAGIAAACLAVHHDLAVFLWDRIGIATRPEAVAGTLPEARAQAERILGEMTLPEKIEQLHGKRQMRGTVNRRLDVPSFQTADGPHGVGEAVWRYLYRHTDRATAFPVGIAIAATWDPELAERVGGAIGREARAKGRNWLLAPAIDLVRDPRAGRVFEAYGEDPFLSGALGAAYVRGAQAEGVIATPKHFVCHHHETDRFDIDVRVGERALRELYLPPFEAAIREGGALSVMAASHSVNGEHCTQNRFLLDTVLRRDWGFEGVVVSDWKSTSSTEASLRAGLDLEMPSPVHYGDQLLRRVESGELPVELVDRAVTRVLAVKLAAGLFARPLELDPTVIGSAAHRTLALETARESIVLLQNRDRLLPLELDGGATLAVLGPWARRAALGGRGSSEVRPLRPVSLVEGLRRVAPGSTRIESPDWHDAAAVERSARAADTVVLALGLGPLFEGESLDRVGNRLGLPDDQRELIERVTAVSSRVVVVLFAGSAIAMDPWIERVPAIVEAWYPGELGGRAVAEVLVGAVDPSGRLPLTFPREESQLPAFPDFPERVSEYREGVFVGYRHYDAAGIEPLFPFGHGLSYTRFVYSRLRAETRGSGEEVAVEVRFTVRNAGDREGTEVAQVYVRDLASSVARPPRELRGFERVELQPGERRVVALTLDWRDLAFWDESRGAFTVEPGEFELEVGSSSRDIRLARRFAVPPPS